VGDQLSGQGSILSDGQCMTISDLTIILSIDLSGLNTVAKDQTTCIFVSLSSASNNCLQFSSTKSTQNKMQDPIALTFIEKLQQQWDSRG
jgi:hypothetical protein